MSGMNLMWSCALANTVGAIACMYWFNSKNHKYESGKYSNGTSIVNYTIPWTKNTYCYAYYTLRVVLFLVFSFFHCKYMVHPKRVTYETRRNAVKSITVLLIEHTLCVGFFLTGYFAVGPYEALE